MVVLWLALGYLAGSFPTGVVVARLRGIDITHVGSGNIGATNVARNLGKPLGALVLLVDAAKGFAPVWVAMRVLHLAPEIVAGVGLLAILGHVFPIWLKLRGGKGVATGLGVFLAIDPLAAAVAVMAWIGLYGAFRISSLGSLVASISIPVTLALRHAQRAYLVMAGVVLALVLFRHRGNIRRLVKREESKI